MNETVDDIVAEMRKLGELDEKSTDKIPRSLMGLGLRTYADRLEAEAEPVGNAAAMREVLKPWIAFAEWLLENAGKDKLGEAIRENGPIIRQRMKELRAALSAPPRQCDVGTAEEQFKRYRAFCHSESRGCEHCPANRTMLRGTSNCDLAWAQMPYNEGSAE